jgi:hypothetical protein
MKIWKKGDPSEALITTKLQCTWKLQTLFDWDWDYGNYYEPNLKKTSWGIGVKK